MNDDEATSSNCQHRTGINSELILSDELIPRVVEASIHDDVVSSSRPQASLAELEVPYIVGYEDIIPGMLVTNAIQGLLYGITIFGFNEVENISKGVFNVASTLAARSGNEEDIVIHLEQVLAYIENTPELAELGGTLWHCHFLYRFAQVFARRGHMENAKRALYSAQKIAAKCSNMEYLVDIWNELIGIHDDLQENQLLLNAKMAFLQICEPLLLSPSAWSEDRIGYILGRVGRTRFELGCANNDIEQMEDGMNYLTNALQMNGEKKNENIVSNLLEAMLLVELAKCYYSMNSVSRHSACLILLEQGIAAFQQLECLCNSLKVDSSFIWSDTGVVECGRHQLLADAFQLQGIVQQDQGFTEEAQESFERGLNLVEKCKDRNREAGFHLLLAQYLHFKTHLGTAFVLQQIEDSPHYSILLYEQMQDHFRSFLKKTIPGARFDYDQWELFANSLINPPEESFGTMIPQVEAYHVQLQIAEERGDYSRHPQIHVALCVDYFRMDDIDACKQHFFLSLKYLVTSSANTTSDSSTSVKVLQTLGWIAMQPQILDLDRAYEIWQKVYRAVDETLEGVARISEYHALRYYEISKQACMALATCQLLREKVSESSPEYRKPGQSYVDSALVWAERGKGRMLMSFIEASTQRNDDPASQFDKGRFLTDDTYAFDFICNRPRASSLLSQSEKMVFVEYTFQDYRHLMIQIFIDGPSSTGTLYCTGVVCLHCELSEDVRREAETYLYSVPEWSKAVHSSTGPVIEDSISKVLSAMNKYSTNRIPFNPWIPGIVVGIQTQVGKAIEKLKVDPNSSCMKDLSIVPFAALHEANGSRYLIEDYAISMSPSIWCTRHCQHLYEKAHKEVDAIAEILKSTVTVLNDTSLGEMDHARMMEVLPNASWIHLSVHGEVSSQFPQGSLLFSNNDSQRLTAEEIMTVAPSAWRARAVIASACQTGLGAVAGGGVMGFARSFMLAGVPSSVLTMWEANETFCTMFMKDLYEQLASGYSLAHAMQKVMVHYIRPATHDKKGKRKTREPKWSIIHWACFSSFGLPNVTLPNTKERMNLP